MTRVLSTDGRLLAMLRNGVADVELEKEVWCD